jgi:hypothetical protein
MEPEDCFSVLSKEGSYQMKNYGGFNEVTVHNVSIMSIFDHLYDATRIEAYKARLSINSNSKALKHEQIESLNFIHF